MLPCALTYGVNNAKYSHGLLRCSAFARSPVERHADKLWIKNHALLCLFLLI